MKRLLFLVLVLVVGCGPELAPNPEYAARIGTDWHPVTVGDGQVSLASGADSVQCHVNSYGWKLLDMTRIKATRDAWFQRGRAKQKWGWKLLIHNAGAEPIAVRIDAELMSDQDIGIRHITFGRGAGRARVMASLYGGGPVWSDTGENVVLGGETKLFSGTSWYWLDEHQEEGRPDRLEWSVQHVVADSREPAILQTMAVRSSQPSN